MDQFIATANPLVEQIQRSIANNRYSGLDLIRVVANSVTRTGVCYFPVLPDRISNIGVYDKYFVLVYADKVHWAIGSSSMWRLACVSDFCLPDLQPSHVVVDVKRMNADGTLLRYVMDMMVFFMCLPFVGFPSMSPLELVENASTAWKGITNKKNGRRAPPYYVYDKDLSAVLIPLQKQLDFTDIIVMSSFSSSSFGEDGTAWCDVREGIMPLLVSESKQQR